MGVRELQASVRRLPSWAAPVAVGAAALCGCVALAVVDPELRTRIYPGCPFRLATGLDCPGCGGTRAVLALFQGDVLLALDHNVVTVLLLPVLVWAWARWLLARLGRGTGPVVLAPAVSMGLAATLTVFMVVRNLPWAPFTSLASTPLG